MARMLNICVFLVFGALFSGVCACERLEEANKAKDEAVETLVETKETAEELSRTISETKKSVEETKESAEKKVLELKSEGQRKVKRGVLYVKRNTPRSQAEANKLVVNKGQSLMKLLREWFSSISTKEGLVARNRRHYTQRRKK